MTRSDLMLTVAKLDKMSDKEKNNLIYKMHYKIENAYLVLFGMEKAIEFKPLSEALRKALES